MRPKTDDAFGIGFNTEDSFICFNFQNRITKLYLGAVINQPVDQDDLVNGLA